MNSPAATNEVFILPTIARIAQHEAQAAHRSFTAEVNHALACYYRVKADKGGTISYQRNRKARR